MNFLWLRKATLAKETTHPIQELLSSFSVFPQSIKKLLALPDLGI